MESAAFQEVAVPPLSPPEVDDNDFISHNWSLSEHPSIQVSLPSFLSNAILKESAGEDLLFLIIGALNIYLVFVAAVQMPSVECCEWVVLEVDGPWWKQLDILFSQFFV